MFSAPLTPGNVQMHWPEANARRVTDRTVQRLGRDGALGEPETDGVAVEEPLEIASTRPMPTRYAAWSRR